MVKCSIILCIYHVLKVRASIAYYMVKAEDHVFYSPVFITPWWQAGLWLWQGPEGTHVPAHLPWALPRAQGPISDQPPSQQCCRVLVPSPRKEMRATPGLLNELHNCPSPRQGQDEVHGAALQNQMTPWPAWQGTPVPKRALAEMQRLNFSWPQEDRANCLSSGWGWTARASLRTNPHTAQVSQTLSLLLRTRRSTWEMLCKIFWKPEVGEKKILEMKTGRSLCMHRSILQCHSHDVGWGWDSEWRWSGRPGEQEWQCVWHLYTRVLGCTHRDPIKCSHEVKHIQLSKVWKHCLIKMDGFMKRISSHVLYNAAGNYFNLKEHYFHLVSIIHPLFFFFFS